MIGIKINEKVNIVNEFDEILDSGVITEIEEENRRATIRGINREWFNVRLNDIQKIGEISEDE